MKLKFTSLVVAGLSPFLFFLPQLRSKDTNLSYQLENKFLLLDSKSWKINLNLSYCKSLDGLDYAGTKKLVVKCKEESDPSSKELAFPAYALLFEDAISFWVEIEKEEFKDNLIHFYSFYWSEKNKEKVNKYIPKNCLFEGIYKNEYSFCLVNWKELNSSLKFIERSKDISSRGEGTSKLQFLKNSAINF